MTPPALPGSWAQGATCSTLESGWCAGRCVATRLSLKKYLWFASFASFCGVNPSTMAHFKLPMWRHWIGNWEECNCGQMWAAWRSRIQHSVERVLGGVRTHWHTGLPRSQGRRHRSMPLPETGRAHTAHCTALQWGWGRRVLAQPLTLILPLTGCGRAGTGQPQRDHPAQGQNPWGPQPLPHLVCLVLSYCREKQIGVWELTCPQPQCWGRRTIGKESTSGA